MLCPISWAIPQPNKEPDKYFPFSAASNGIPFDKPDTEPHSIPIWFPPAYIKAPANILW